MVSRRLQIQERITKQVCEILEEVLQPKGIAAVMESRYLLLLLFFIFLLKCIYMFEKTIIFTK